MAPNVAASRLKQLVKLSERKELLLAQLQDIDREMVRLQHEFRHARKSRRNKGRVTVSGQPITGSGNPPT